MFRRTHTLAAAVLAIAAYSLLSAIPAQQPLVVSKDDSREVKLTEPLVERYFAAQEDIIVRERQSRKTAKQQSKGRVSPFEPIKDPELIAEMEAIVKKHGFASPQDYKDTEETYGHYVFPVIFKQDFDTFKTENAPKRTQYEAEIADVANDAMLDDKQKAKVTAVLKKEYNWIKPLQYPENFDLLTKMKDRIDSRSTRLAKQSLEEESGQ